MIVGPAQVVVNKFDGRGVECAAFRDMRAMVEHYITERRLYTNGYDDADLIVWLESLKPRVDAAVANIIREREEDAEGM